MLWGWAGVEVAKEGPETESLEVLVEGLAELGRVTGRIR